MKLSLMVDIISGGTPKTNIKEYWDGGDIDWLSVNDFNNDQRYVYESEKKITNYGLKNSNTKLLEKGDIIISARGTVGSLAQLAKPMCFNQSCFGLRGKKNIVETDFLFYSLKNYVHNIKKMSHGSVFSTINLNSFELMEMQIPDLFYQKKIANVLSALDAKIELNNQINAELEKMAKTIYDYWFVQFDFPDANGKPYKSSGGKMVWNEELKREIPEGWEVKNLFSSKYTKLVTTGITKFEGEKTYLSTSEVENSQIINHSIKTNYLNRKSRANMQPKPKTIWFARMKDTKKIILIDDYCDDLIENYIFSTGFAGLETSKDFLYFLWCFINSKDFEDIKNRHATGTTQKSITNEGIEKIKILIPSQDLLNIFDSKLSNFYQKIYVNNKQNQTLSELRDWLLPMLMNGQVKVE